jgi:hypothetical protein
MSGMGFEPFRDEPMRLWLMLKDVRGQSGIELE